jgi:hypothetical protein
VPDAADRPPPTLAAGAARARWRAAEDRLYPTVLADPATYQRGLAAAQAVVAELRVRAADFDALLAAEAAADEVVAAACPGGAPLPAELLVGAACGMRDRELAAERAESRRAAAVRAAQEAGDPWAVLDGPAGPGELTSGRCVQLHLASGTVLEATVDPWSGAEPFGLQVLGTAGTGAGYASGDRSAWLTEHARLRARIEAGQTP